jgi:hypothetical protein
MAAPGSAQVSREEKILEEIGGRIERRTFQIVEAHDGIMRKRAELLYELYLQAGPQEKVELAHREKAQEYFSGQVRAYVEAKGFDTWDAFVRPSTDADENARLRGALVEDWMRLPPGTRKDPVAMYLILMKHEAFGITGARPDENGLDWVQEVLVPEE